MKVTRRTALTTLLASSAASCASNPVLTPFTSPTRSAQAGRASSANVFQDGVASGDPQSTKVILWTRISDENGNPFAQPQNISWEIASDKDFNSIQQSGTGRARAVNDGTFKIDAQGLQPGQSYYYRFLSGPHISPIGRTRTLPAGPVEQANFAVISCSNYPFGFFNVYDQIARRNNLDAVIHLGDYIYEYGNEGYGGEQGKTLNRNHAPGHETISLQDYRTRHKQYKSDPAAQAMHAAHPLIAIWDDHETANNSWKDGAQNHTPKTEGEWATRRRAALQAYYEWMPVRDPQDANPREAFFRSFSYGDLLTIGAIETRLMARSAEIQFADALKFGQRPEDIERFKNEVINDPKREMLGTAQTKWLSDVFTKSKNAGQPWRLLANQIIMAKVTAPDLTPHVTEEEIVDLQSQWDQGRAFVEASTLGLPTNFDAWDGYPAARERFYDMVKNTTDAQGLIVLTGDTHTWWANDLRDKEGELMGVELGVHSVTSPSPYSGNFLGGRGAEYALLLNQKNKDVRYLSGQNHGYIDLSVTPQKAEAKFMAVDTVEQPDYNAFEKVGFTISHQSRSGAAKFKGTSGLTFKERFLF